METTNEDGWPSGTVLYGCPWCPVQVPVPPWKIETEGDFRNGETARVVMRVTRTAWELTMLNHWRDDHPDRYAEFADQVLCEMGRDVQEAADSARAMLDESLRNARIAPGRTEPARSRIAPPPWAAGRTKFRVDLAPPPFQEFMRGWHGL
jgi:hypothetical protein